MRTGSVRIEQSQLLSTNNVVRFCYTLGVYHSISRDNIVLVEFVDCNQTKANLECNNVQVCLTRTY